MLADLVMSLDNVIAVAGAAKGSTTLLVIGLAISIPMIVFGSQLLLTLMDRYPVIITLGAALLGWVAGEMAIGDPIIKDWIDAQAAFLHYAAPAAGAIGVVLVGKWLASRTLAARVEVPAVVPAHALGELQRVLLAVDGSEGAAQAARRLIALRQNLRDPTAMDLHLINVQRPVSGDVARFVSADALEEYHNERSEKALTPARELLKAAGLCLQGTQARRRSGPDHCRRRTGPGQRSHRDGRSRTGLAHRSAARLGGSQHDRAFARAGAGREVIRRSARSASAMRERPLGSADRSHCRRPPRRQIEQVAPAPRCRRNDRSPAWPVLTCAASHRTDAP